MLRVEEAVDGGGCVAQLRVISHYSVVAGSQSQLSEGGCVSVSSTK